MMNDGIYEIALLGDYNSYEDISTIAKLYKFLDAGTSDSGYTIATTFSQIKGLLVVAAFLSALFPPLAGILGVIAINMFIIKLKFLVQNWRAVLAGLFIYIYPFYVNRIYNKNLYSYYNSSNKFGYVISGILLFQLVMKFLYYYGYSSKAALTILGMLPLMIIIFLLSSVIAEIQGSVQGFENYNSYPPNNPNINSVKGHYRQTPSGGVIYVHPHIRTNTDGIESNNISYKK